MYLCACQPITSHYISRFASILIGADTIMQKLLMFTSYLYTSCIDMTLDKTKVVTFKKGKEPCRTCEALNVSVTSSTSMCLDSGTTSHMVRRGNDLEDAESCSVSIALGDNSTITSTQKGTKKVTWSTPDGPASLSLSNTLASSELAMNLLSAPALTEKRIAVLFMPRYEYLQDMEDEMFMLGTAKKQTDGLYRIGTDEGKKRVGAPKIPRATMAVINSLEKTAEDEDACADDASDASHAGTSVSSASVWHRRLGHVGTKKDIAKMIAEGNLPKPSQQVYSCDPCNKRKFKRFFRGTLSAADVPGHIQADAVGEINPKSSNGYLYFLTIIDEATRFPDVFFLNSKKEASKYLVLFLRKFERQTGTSFKSLHTDGGSEFLHA